MIVDEMMGSYFNPFWPSTLISKVIHCDGFNLIGIRGQSTHSNNFISKNIDFVYPRGIFYAFMGIFLNKKVIFYVFKRKNAFLNVMCVFYYYHLNDRLNFYSITLTLLLALYFQFRINTIKFWLNLKKATIN